MFLVLLVIPLATAVLPAQHNGHRAEANQYYRQPSRVNGERRRQQPVEINNDDYPEHSRLVIEQDLPVYSDDDSDTYNEVNYQPTVAFRAPHQRSRGSYVNGELRYRSHVPVQTDRVQQTARHVPEAGRFRTRVKAAVQTDRLPIEDLKNTNQALEAEGSRIIPVVEEDAYEDEDVYGDAYEEHPVVESEQRIGVIGGPVVVTGGVSGGGVGVGSSGVAVGGGGIIGGGQSFGQSHGKKEGHGYQHEDHHGKGQKGAKKHKTNENYDKGHVEKHGHEHNKGGKKEAFGIKKGHIDENKVYHKGDSHKKDSKEEDKFHSKSHKKGKKTSGSRNLHHKDEFEKNEVFFDEEHDAGHEKVKNHELGGHHESKGGASKKGHLNSGYKDAFKGAEGEKKEGHRYANSKGHSGHIGHKAEEEHGEGFHKAGGHKGQEARGHYYKKAGGGASFG